jgi:opacity protein-like surface antigen
MKRFVLSMLAIMLLGTFSRADLSRGSQTATVFGGLGGSGSDYDYEPGQRRPVTGGGGAFGGQYLYYVSGIPALAVGGDLASSPNANRRSGDLLSGYESTARLKSLIGLAMVRLSFPRGVCRPYIFGGVGAHNSDQQLSAQPQPGNTWPGGGTESRILVDEHKTSAALGYGIGLDIYPKESFFIGIELRGVWLLGLDNDDTPALRAAGFNVDQKEGLTQGNLFLRTGIKF